MFDELKSEIDALKAKVGNLIEIVKTKDKRNKLIELEKVLADPKLWTNPEKTKVLLQEKKALEKEIKNWEDVTKGVEELETLLGMAKETDLADLQTVLKELLKKADAVELATLLGGKYDISNAILSINAGAGGTDAQDWAQILLRMYCRFCEEKEYKVEMPDISYGEEAGIKSAIILVTGAYAYGYLKNETGIHRLVRMSPFNADGKRHTSFAAVEVIPEMSEEIVIEINPKDLRIDTYRASGPGGQNVNKTDSAVRITHIPTGITAQSQSDRSQHANRESAMRILKARLYEMLISQRKEKIDELRGEKKKIEWGSQIRSYIFQPYTMVKDHRTGKEVGNAQKVIDGFIEPFIEASLKKGVDKNAG